MTKLKRVLAICLVVLPYAACSTPRNSKTRDSEHLTETTTAENVPSCQEGQICDDGDPCTNNDRCTDNVCQGQPIACPQPKCARVSCKDGQCAVSEILSGWCYIDKQCYQEGALSPHSDCLVCQADKKDDWTELPTGTPCEDGNPCTQKDYCDHGVCFGGTPPSCADGILCTKDKCDPLVGCLHTPQHEMCADDNPCTKDLCSPQDGGCVNIPDDSLPCGDGNVCTVNDRCKDGECVHDPEPLDCDDGNPCTDELCHESFGCVYVFNHDPCDDGAACTSGDQCHLGKCVGEDPWNQCPPCNLQFSDYTLKISKLQVGKGGFEGQAVNVDNDMKTCSPPGNCELGLDNALSFAGELINDFFAQVVQDPANDSAFLFELQAPDFNGQEFSVAYYYGWLCDEYTPQNPCNPGQDKCNYCLSSMNFDPLCNAQVVFDNCTIQGNTLLGGGSGYYIPIQMWFSNGQNVEFIIYNAKLQIHLNISESGELETAKGVFGGAVTKEDIAELITAIPQEYLPSEQKSALLGLIDLLVEDIDVNGDNTYDACSIGLVFEAVPASILPYSEY